MSALRLFYEGKLETVYFPRDPKWISVSEMKARKGVASSVVFDTPGTLVNAVLVYQLADNGQMAVNYAVMNRPTLTDGADCHLLDPCPKHLQILLAESRDVFEHFVRAGAARDLEKIEELRKVAEYSPGLWKEFIRTSKTVARITQQDLVICMRWEDWRSLTWDQRADDLKRMMPQFPMTVSALKKRCYDLELR